MVRFVVLPGINGSGETHWQTEWERASPNMRRFQPPDWDRPKLAEWMTALDEAAASAREPTILVAHSLSCLLAAHWAGAGPNRVAGAFLVSVPDPTSNAFPAEGMEFADPPRERLPFPSMVVTSADDPYGSVDYQTSLANDWGSRHVRLGPLGHINGASGLGDWPHGRALLDDFARGVVAD